MANTLKMNLSSLPKTVIFCSKKKTVSSVHRFLHCSDRSSVTMYHASLTEQTKKAVYDEFSKPASYIRCLVSTLAFGMVCMHACIVRTMLVYPKIFVEIVGSRHF